MPLTVTDLADFLNTTTPTAGTQQYREMQRALDTAVQETTRRTGMLDAVTVTVQVSMDSGDRALRLPFVRLASVGTVTDPAGTVSDTAGVDLLAGVVPISYGVPAGWFGLSSTWSVQCTGRPWPAALETSALEWAAHLYDTQRARIHPVDEDQQLPSFAVPNRVDELQRPYLLAGVA
jgi:hypothetical protein